MRNNRNEAKKRTTEEEQPPSVGAPLPAAEPQPSAAHKPKESATATPPPPQPSLAQQPEGTKFRLFDYVDPDDQKHAYVREMTNRKEFAKALVGYYRIIDPIADDHRCACECKFVMGKNHADKRRFKEAITCYIEALNLCKDILQADVRELDVVNISKVFNSLVHVMSEVTKTLSVNFSFASECIVDFLNFYLDNFEALNKWNKKLPGLDEMKIDFIYNFLLRLGDEAAKEKTRVYLTIIEMFRKEARLENDGLESIIAEIEIKTDMWEGTPMLDTFDLIQKAAALVKNLKDHPAINPKLKASLHPEQKRKKDTNASSSSSSIPRYSY